VCNSLSPLKIKSPKIISIVILLVCGCTLLHARLALAEALYRQFSLGAGNLTQAPADAKAPEPGIVTAKYGIKISKDFMPYMGTGLAYTYQPDVRSGEMTKVQTGVAAQFGFSYLFDANSSLKMDYKYLSLPTDLPRGDSKSTPQSIGIGFDIKF